MKSAKVLYGVMIAAFCANNARAQLNIIDNGGFELFTSCPSGYTTFVPQVPYAYGWFQPTFAGTSDYFNACAPSNNDADVPKNYFGTQAAHNGNAYAGLLAYIDQVAYQPNLSREYIQTKTTRPLKAGRVYYFEMYVSLADRATYRYAVNNLGAYMSPDQIKRPDADAFQYTPQVVSSSYLTDNADWTKISGTFIANGGETYVTIGRFGPNNPSNITSLPGDVGNLFSYYYIDDVTLIDSCAELDDLTEGILGQDTDFCSFHTPYRFLNAANSKTKTYLWSTGETSQSISVSNPGTYWVKLMNGSCFNYDTVRILNTPKLDIGLGNDTAICFGIPLQLKPKTESPSYSYKWYANADTVFKLVSANSFYNINYAANVLVEVNYGQCTNRDTILIKKSFMDSLVLIRDTTVCRKTHIPLDATTRGANRYLWSTQETNPRIMSLADKNKVYWAQATDGLCTSRDSVRFTLIGSVPVPRDTSFCTGTSLTLYADPNSSSILWSTGATTPSITLVNDGLYTLTQLKNGCAISDTIRVTIDSIPVIDLGADTTICDGSFINLFAWTSYASRYLWSNGDTSEYVVATKANQYAVRVSNASCSFNDTITISIQTRESFSLGRDTSYCFNTPVTLAGPSSANSYLWNNNSTDSVLKIYQSGKYWLKTIKGVCINSDTILLLQKPLPLVNLGKDTSLCVGKKIVLDAQNPGNVYQWSNGSNMQTITVSDTNIYWVKVTGNIGCWAADSIAIKNYPQPVLLANDIEVLCKDSQHVISAASGMKSYLWQDGSKQSDLEVKTPGIFTLKAIDKFGCVNYDTVNILEKPRPDVLTETFYELCEPDFYAETSIPYQSYLWQDGSTLSKHHIQDYGMYSLTVTDTNQCTNTAIIEVKKKCVPSVLVPNVFSPNGDGKNDAIIPGYKYIAETEFSIFNRWGQLLFHTTDIHESWDGTSGSGPSEPGVYYFVLKCRGNEDQKFEQTGTITLIR